MIKYKIDVQAELVKRGYTTYRIKQDNLLPGQTLSNLKNGKMVNMETLGKICAMLRCQPGDIIESVVTDEEKIKYF